MTTHYHTTESGRVLKIVTQFERDAIASINFTDGAVPSEALDVLDGILAALEQVALDRGMTVASACLSLPSGKEIFFMAQRGGRAFSTRKLNSNRYSNDR